MYKKASGFTLIEILTVLMIISFIMFMAYPHYKSYIYKSNRLDAINSLFHTQALWQRCMLHQPDAQGCLTAIGLNQNLISLHEHYQISAIDLIFKAVPVGSQAEDSSCAVFLLDTKGSMRAYDKEGQLSMRCW